MQNIQNRIKVQDSAFREYDIRGKVESEIPLEAVYDLTKTIAYYLKQRDAKINSIAVGMDGRTHSEAIHERVCAALVDSGLQVVSFGLCPSPVLYFGMQTLPTDAGIMITASHNPKEYNGFKMCLGKEFLWGKEVKAIRSLYHEGKQLTVDKKGTLRSYPIIDDYIAWMTNHFPILHKSNVKAIIDCGNATGGTVIPRLIEAFEWRNVQTLYPEIDGTYPHHDADPVVEKNMADVKKLLLQGLFDIGIGLDGDCDRMAPMAKNGWLVPGDQLLALFCQPVVSQIPGAPIVCDIKSSSGLCELLARWQGNLCMVPTGHASVHEAMQKEHALVGGELSCHFFFADRYFGYDDGIYAALRLLEILQTSGKDLSEALSFFPAKHNTPEIRINCAERDPITIVDHLKEEFAHQSNVSLITIDGIRATRPYGWGIVRASNTQSVLSMRFESDTAEGLRQIKKDFADLLVSYVDQKDLLEHFGAKQ